MEVAAAAATVDEVEAIATLAREARQELATFRGGAMFVARHLAPEPLEEMLADAVGDPLRLVLVGTVDRTPVGYSLARDAAGVVLVEEIAVHPEARAVGVGEALLQAVVTWGRERGCSGIDAYALPGARETKNFFETAGMKARLLVVHTAL